MSIQDNDTILAPEMGQQAPNFTAPIQYPDRTEEFSLSKTLAQKKRVLLVFYPGDDTPGCTKQLCGLRDDYSEFEKYNVEVVGVNHASEQSHLNFIQKYSFPFGIIVDTNKSIRDAYGATKKFFNNLTTKRGVFLIDTDQTILYRYWGQQNNQEVIDVLKNSI